MNIYSPLFMYKKSVPLDILLDKYYAGDQSMFKPLAEGILTLVQKNSHKYYHRVQVSSDLKDIASIAAMKTIENVQNKEFLKKSKLSTYACSILNYTFLAYVSNDRKVPQTIEISDRMNTVADELDDSSSILNLEQEQQYVQCNEFVKTLNPQSQLLFELRFKEGESYKSLSTILHSDERAIRIRAHRLKNKIRDHFQ